MIMAIVFDCFGVLAGKSYWDVYKAGGGDSVKDEEFITSMVDKANRGQVTQELFSSVMADRLGMSMAEYRALLTREEAANTELLAYIRKELKPKYKLAVLSNAAAGVVARKIPAEEYALFDVVIESATTPYAKPDREIFELVASKLGVTFDEMIFIDDLEQYVVPASQMGIHAIRYTGVDAMKHKLGSLLT
ncbi:MAG TPA: HAD-IA family hydrolase [Bacillota bacterium]|nr:HAD-IA family hydrolase [Bacillota bacterium]